MTKAPRVSGKRVIAALRRAGFKIIRIKGSHHFLQHSDGRRTVVPVHAGESIGPGHPPSLASPKMRFLEYCGE